MHPILRFLVLLGLNPKHKGFIILAYVIQVLLIEPSKLHKPMKNEIYPLLEKQFGSSYENARRALKFAIKEATINNNPELKKRIFPNTHKDFPPSVSDFLYSAFGILQAELSRYTQEEREECLTSLKPVSRYELTLFEAGIIETSYKLK